MKQSCKSAIIVICFDEDPKIGYLQKLILFLSIFKQSEVAMTTKACFEEFTGLDSFFYLIILQYKQNLKKICLSNLRFKPIYFILISIFKSKMSSTLKTNKQKLEEMKKRRQERNKLTSASQMTESNQSQLKIQKRQFSLQKSETIHVTGSLIETYDMQVQCALQTRSLDSKAHKQIQQQQKEVDLLQPKQQKKKRQDRKDGFQTREIHQLNIQELQSLVKSKHFTDFFNKSSKFLEKVLDHGDGDMLQLILKDGFKVKQANQHDILAHGITFNDHNYTVNRVVTSLDWSPQISQLLLASYSKNQEGSIKDHVGVALLWNPALKNRPEFYCFCQSPITSAKFFPFSNNTVIGGCYNGQLLLWDIRVKSMPVQRSDISADAHKYPVNSLSIVGTQIANNIASFSNDGMMCFWDIKMFSKPIRNSRIQAAKPTKYTSKPSSSLAGSSLINKSTRLTQVSTTSALQRTREQPQQVNVTCCEFPKGDTNNYYIGSLNGAMYKNALHNKATSNIVMYDDHVGPISSLSVNYSPEYDFLNGLVLTSSFDWTVKLWNPNNNKQPLKTFQNSEDFLYDIQWNPSNPSVFACTNNEGYIDLYDLTKDLELPITHKKVSNFAQNKMAWNPDGSALATGDSTGSVNLFVLSQKYRKIDPSKAQNLRSMLVSQQRTQ